MSIAPFEYPPGEAWVVTRQEPDQVAFVVPGEPVYGVNIYFQTAAGNRGVVFIPNDRYHDVKGIHAAIQAKAVLADTVQNLASSSFQQ